VRPGVPVRAIAALHNADYAPDRLEILIVEGDCPSRQRNYGACQASGDILYFLDDDSLIAPDALRRLALHYRALDVHAVGGPSLTPPDEPLLSRCIGYALGTRLGAWTMQARYAPIGHCRPASEKEVIGCNLSMRRLTFETLGGFREDLFPNEETELTSRLLRNGHTLLYDPDLVVRRAQRRSLAGLARQFFAYGRGRLRQLTRTFSRSTAIFLAPAIGLTYMLWWFILGWTLSTWTVLPLLVYGGLVLSTSLYLSWTRRAAASLVILPILFAIIHTCYGCGLIAEGVQQVGGRVLNSFTGRQRNQKHIRRHPVNTITREIT
jgi:glycosyltransferase involved in cell wall biosynthesis